ncbi:CocE/NonD family hydrolase [Variovorax soli]|uniref:Pimeloyl-ACP methyl ester carboxylesterase n=1 Tax=Variovorax soli TaxID=376815 RepID=A0ABU1NFG7_9BURK|nr:CocE/NonD family hydrolase [Variovorax soli]MDR6537213.1 pimeloyl-ACP methyl ester carboxylesterase [Variovorax soli]
MSVTRECRRRILLAAASTIALKVGAQASAQSDELVEEVTRFPLVDGDITYELEMTLMRPPTIDNRMPVLVMNHGVPSNKRQAAVLRRARPISQARLFVSAGFVVAIPMRRGYGQSEGGMPSFSCDIHQTAWEEPKDIEAAVRHLQSLPFVRPDALVLLGVSAGALASFAAAARIGHAVLSVINFSGGRRLRGPMARDCYPQELLSAFSRFGAEVSVPTLWLYSPNDVVFPAPLVAECLSLFRASGGKAEFAEVPTYRGDPHDVFSNADTMPIWAARVRSFLGDRSIKVQKVS